MKGLLPKRRQSAVKSQVLTLAMTPPQLQIKKTAAMQEAELFMDRLGPNWSVEQVEFRIKHLYRLVNEAFERAYLTCVSENRSPTARIVAADHMREIRALQSMVEARRAPKPVVARLSEISLQFPRDVYEDAQISSSFDCTIRTPPYSCSIEQLSPAVHEHLQEVRPTSPLLFRDITTGMEFNGVSNRVSLAFYPRCDDAFPLYSSQLSVGLAVRVASLEPMKSQSLDQIEELAYMMGHNLNIQQSKDSNWIPPFHAEVEQFHDPIQDEIVQEDFVMIKKPEAVKTEVKDLDLPCNSFNIRQNLANNVHIPRQFKSTSDLQEPLRNFGSCDSIVQIEPTENRRHSTVPVRSLIDFFEYASRN